MGKIIYWEEWDMIIYNIYILYTIYVCTEDKQSEKESL